MNSQHKVFVNRTFNCSVSELFNWLVMAELIIQWFGPKQISIVKVSTDVRVGGKYSIELKKRDTQNFFIIGEYIKINAPYELDFSFQYKGLSNTPPNSIVKIKLEEVTPNESHLSLIQKFESLPSDMDNRTKGWQHMFSMLADRIETSISNYQQKD